MEIEDALLYLQAIDSIEAKETLVQIQINEFSHNMKKNDRTKMQRDLKKIASKYDKIETKSMDDFESLFKGMIGG